MNRESLKRRIDVAAGRTIADLVIKNCNVVNVYSGNVVNADIAVCDGVIAGIGNYEGREVIDAEGFYAIPGLIDSHIHIESSFVTPEEISRLLVPHGTTTIIADPHEIANVAGIDGINYMLAAAGTAALDIKYMLPSCVPATPFENSGACINASNMKSLISNGHILGLGEFMNFVGVTNADPDVMDKLLVCMKAGKTIDGHSPNLSGLLLNAYCAAGVCTDHECTTVEEMHERIANGMYVQLRYGSACNDLQTLVKGITPYNSRRCLLCSDDRQPKTIFEEGHLEKHLKMCVEAGIDPITAIQMATINAAECYQMQDRGALVPGRRADIVLLRDLKEFRAEKVFISGKLTAQSGRYLLDVNRTNSSSAVKGMKVKGFSKERLKLKLNSNKVHTIGIIPGSIVTTKKTAVVKLDSEGDFIFDPKYDIAKLTVIERHHNTGQMAVGLIQGYGIQHGAVALSVAHDSHNIIAAGVSDEEIACAVEKLIAQDGGIVLVKDGTVLESLPLPVAGLMSDQSGEWVDEQLVKLHRAAFEVLKVNKEIDPLMTLCFMALPVIPEIKMTDKGLFDVNRFEFIEVNAE